MLLLCFISFTVFGIYSVLEVKSIYNQLTEEQIRKTTKDIIDQRQAYLEKEATLIQKDLEKVEQNLLLLQKQAEFVFSQTSRQQSFNLPDFHLERHPEGFYWEPIDSKIDHANVFISARSHMKKDLIYKDLQKAKQLEPLLKQTVKNESILKGVFFVLPDSAWIIYPAMDVPYEVSINKLPPDILVQEHEFYYLADMVHNPQKILQWTKKYSDVTQWGMMITALVPVYLPDGTFRGVIGADFPINKITTRIEGLSFAEPNASAFLLDQSGSLIAGNEKRFNRQFDSRFSLDLTNKGNSTTGFKQVFTDDESGENYYILSAVIPNTQWTLNFSIPEDDIVQPIIHQADGQLSLKLKQFINRLLLFLIFISGLLIILSFIFSNKVIRPINQLTTAIKENASGTYGSQIPVHSNDEIGQLTTTFNEMSITIHNLVEELNLRADYLEERVSQRTKELELSNIQLLQTFEQLKRSENARTELILHISHDLKTPLTKVKGFLQVIKGFDVSAARQKEYIELILMQTNHMIELMNNLFELSSLHVNSLTFKKEWYAVDFLIDHAIQIVCKEGTEQPVTITTDYEEDLPLVFIDPKEMNRALTNILGNALKYAKPNSDIHVQCRAFVKNGHLILTFQDNGIGINEENLNRIFDPYYREIRTETNDILGNGIGMSIVKKIVEGHGGTIDVKSVVNEGTCIIISLPIEMPA